MKKKFTLLLMMLTLVILTTTAGVADGTNLDDQQINTQGFFSFKDGVLTLFYEDYNDADISHYGSIEYWSVYPSPGWAYDMAYSMTDIKKVVIESSFAVARPTTMTNWFNGCTNLTEIEGIQYLNTSAVTSMRNLFKDCSSLTNIDVSNFNTANVTIMTGMFEGCTNLTFLDVSNFNTFNVKGMSDMFKDCSSLTSLDLSNFDTSNVGGMSDMFRNCSSLTSLDVKNFNTINVTDMKRMFYGCSSLTSLDLSNFKTDNVTYMQTMFRDCSSLTSLDLSNFNTSNVKNMVQMFSDCSNLTNLNLSNFNTAKVTYMDEMFYGCSSLTSLDLSSFNTTNLIKMQYMFSGCSSLTSLDLSNFNTTNITNMESMFRNCSSLTSLNLRNFNTTNITNMKSLFSGCSSLTSLNLSNFNTTNLIDMQSMFSGCSSLTSLDLSNFNTAKVSYMSHMFDGCSSLQNLTFGQTFISKGGCVDVFANCTSLGKIQYTGDIPTRIHDQFFAGVGTAAAPATLDVPAEYRDHYAAKMNGNMFFGGYFTLSGDNPQPEAEPYVVYNNGTLTFYCDNQRSSRVGDTYDLNTGNTYPAWQVNDRKSITKVIFDASFANARPTSTYNWFDVFSNLSEIQGIHYLNTSEVTNMDGMFYGCSNLTNLDLSHFSTNNVTDMSYMFYGCKNLTSLDLSSFNTSKVTKMQSMFYGCEGLTTINVSKFNTANVTDMSYMFHFCKKLTSIDINSFNTTNVTTMSNMFSYCYDLTELHLNHFNTANVTDMNSMFRCCYNITQIDLSSFNTQKVKTIDCMFQLCKKLISIDLSSFDTKEFYDIYPNGDYPGDHAISYLFDGCKELSKLTLGSRFITKDELNSNNIFRDCNSLKTVAFTGDIPATINSKFFNGVGTAATPATLNVPVEYRDHYAAKMNGNQFFGGYFKLSGGEEPGTDIITFADPAVKQICVSNWDTNGDGELSKAEAAAVTDIGTTFRNEKEIVSFDEFQYFTGVTSLAEYAFGDCRKMESIKLPSGIKEINRYAFYYCNKLTSITFPDNEGFKFVDYPFYYCSALTSITLPKNLTSMTHNPFYGCTKLNEINVDAANANYKVVNGAVYTKNGETIVAYPAGREQTEFSIPYGTKSVGLYAFNYNSHLTKVTMPNSVTTIENHGFSDCSKLSTINLPAGLTSIGSYAFGWCYELGNVVIPSTVTTIFSFAFGYCRSMTSVTIPSSVTSIGYSPFIGCRELMSITVEADNAVYDSRGGCNAIILTSSNTLIGGCKNTVIPSTVTYIAHDAFYSCSNLESITIPSSVTSIGSSAFSYCGKLTTITIPASVTSIGNYAFDGCSALTEVQSMIAQPFTISSNVFRVSGNETKFTTATLYVPKGTKSLYQQTDGWKEFQSIVEMGDEPSGKKGDLTGDGEIDGMDLVALVNVIMGQSTQTSAADLNDDGDVDGMDYVAMVNIIMGTAYSRSTEDMEHHINIGMEPLTIAPGESRELIITLQNADMDVTMVQADLKLPQGLSLTGEYTLGNRTTERNHQLYMSGQDGQHRLMLASPKNALLSGTEGAILRLTLTADASFQGGDIVLSNMLCASPTLQAARQQQAVLSLGGTNGITDIDAMGKAAGKKVYSLSGQRMAAPRKGVNIIGGKKYVVK